MGLIVAGDGSKEFLSPSEKLTLNNTMQDAGNLGASFDFNFQYINSFKATLTANTTLTFSNPRAGQVYKIKFVQDGTGGRTVTLPINCIIATGESIDTGANKKSLLILDYDGTEFLCSWKKGF